MNQHNLITYIESANMLVQCVMILLGLISIASWTVIFQRGFILRRCERLSWAFEKAFFKTDSLDALYHSFQENPEKQQGIGALFCSAYACYLKLQRTETSEDTKRDALERAMRLAQTYEQENLENQLPFLASVGAISPYIGLFGTVWGIMSAFQSLGSAQQVTIAMVAPGISEALIATAMGLFAAIPASLFYNRFIAKTDQLLNRFDAFRDELINRLLYYPTTDKHQKVTIPKVIGKN